MAEITLQNIVFPKNPDHHGAYFPSPSPDLAKSHGFGPDSASNPSPRAAAPAQLVDHLDIDPGQSISLLSYFNGFFPYNYYHYWGVRQLTFTLEVSGQGQAALCSYDTASLPHRHAEITEVQEFNSETVSRLTFSVTLDEGLSSKIIYPKITTSVQGARLHGGQVSTAVTTQPAIHLAVVICTFHKEEFVKTTAQALCDYSFPGEITVHIVDNGRTLNPQDFDHPRLRLLPNPNYGGAGGFGRGLLEAVENHKFTHILFMDDDVAIEPDAILRTMAVHQLAAAGGGQPYALCGSMLDFDNPSNHFEGGAWFDPGSMRYRRVHSSLDVSDPAQLCTLAEPREIGYGGWWYFSVSLKDVRQTLMHIPFFIRGDDIEFSYNLRKQLNTKLLIQPGIGLWHVAFGKDPLWLMYYTTRNNLSLGALHYAHRMRRNFLTTIPTAVFISGWQMRYSLLEQILDGIRDFLRGPRFLRKLKADDFHDALRTKVGADPNLELRTMDDKDKVVFAGRPQPRAYGYWVYIRALLTFNGHLLPRFLQSRKPSISDLNDDVRFRIAQCYHGHRHLAFDVQNGTLQIRTKSLGRLLRCFIRAAYLLPWAYLIYPRVVRRWHKEVPAMRTTDFWKDYLNVDSKMD